MPARVVQASVGVKYSTSGLVELNLSSRPDGASNSIQGWNWQLYGVEHTSFHGLSSMCGSFLET